METSTLFAKIVVVNYFLWLVMGSRPNTVAFAAEIREPEDRKNELRSSLLKSIATGLTHALKECQNQFKWEKWNCPRSAFARFFETSTREKGYVASIASAGIVHAVTRSCSRGTFPHCGCTTKSSPQDSVQETWEWHGCSDDVTMGSFVAERFLKSLDSGNKDVVSRTSVHNLKLGRLVVRDSVRLQCKCHGVSGSCTTKTCWKQVAPMIEIGKILKNKYHKAQRIEVNSVIALKSLGIPDYDIVFLDDSPDYCKPNKSAKWHGTGGRICSRNRFNDTDRAEKRSCRELCRSCGHQVSKRPVKISWHCNCTFHWCCDVKCSTCQKTVVQHYCDDMPRRY